MYSLLRIQSKESTNKIFLNCTETKYKSDQKIKIMCWATEEVTYEATAKEDPPPMFTSNADPFKLPVKLPVSNITALRRPKEVKNFRNRTGPPRPLSTTSGGKHSLRSVYTGRWRQPSLLHGKLWSMYSWNSLWVPISMTWSKVTAFRALPFIRFSRTSRLQRARDSFPRAHLLGPMQLDAIYFNCGVFHDRDARHWPTCHVKTSDMHQNCCKV